MAGAGRPGCVGCGTGGGRGDGNQRDRKQRRGDREAGVCFDPGHGCSSLRLELRGQRLVFTEFPVRGPG